MIVNSLAPVLRCTTQPHLVTGTFRFLKLFYRRAYVWQFLEANGEIDSFYVP